MELRRILVRLVGIALLAGGIAGLVLCIAGLIVLDRVTDQAQVFVEEQISVVDQALSATAEGLALADTSLLQAQETVRTLEQTMSGVGQGISDSVPVLDALSDLLGEQLPATIGVTQETLHSLATSAQVVDDVLALITTIPFLGTERYNPDVPLHLGFEEVASSLDEIPASLKTAESGLTATRGNLQAVQQDFATMAQDIGQVDYSLQDARFVLEQYQQIVQDLQTMLSSAHRSLPDWLAGVQVAASLVLIWLGITQLGLITQGWELIGRSRIPPTQAPNAQGSK
jgi:hypothetical protein